MSGPRMSITRLRDRSLLIVSGIVDKNSSEEFSRALTQLCTFSDLPGVIDLRGVAYLHPKAIQELLRVWRGSCDRLWSLEILITVSQQDLLNLTVD